METVDQAPGAWLNMVRRMRFNGLVPGVAGRVIKAVAFDLAACADYVDGSDVRPGLARIAVECEIDYRTAKRCMAAIRALGIIRLVRSAARRGHSDVYQLTMPADILDRVTVLTPSEMDQAIEEIRGGNRRRTVSAGPDDDPGTGHARPRTETPVRVTATPVQPVDNPPVRVTDAPVPALTADASTGHAVPPSDASTGHAVPQYGSRHAPPPSQSTETTTTTEPNDLALRTDLTVIADPPSAEDPHFIEGEQSIAEPCPHGIDPTAAFRCPACNHATGATRDPTRCEHGRAPSRRGFVDGCRICPTPPLRLVQGGAA
ncbi:hypothetical protein [Dactylosporangium salmoneum]|uniref:Helix-turn-helix domain-containing protein n=1 Tax=Dactylosporangium salmoneum TaxID=53361 RepID=A0ABN3FCN5_9ACTN